MKTRIVHSTDVIDCMRFDGSYHNAEINVYDDVIKHHSSHSLSFYCTEIFTSGRNKRVYTAKDYGYPFLSNSDVVAANPFLSCKYSSKKYGYDEKAVLKKGMILTGRVGAIGQTAIVPEYLEKERSMGSDNIIRICVKPEFKNGFIYAYLASRFGNLSFWKHATGGVQPFITDAMVGTLPIPDFSESFQKEVDGLIQESLRLREEAENSLNKAILVFEKEIGISTVELGFNCKVINSKNISSRFIRFDSQYQIGKSQISKYSNTVKIGSVASKVFIGNRGKRNYVQDGVPFLSSSDMMLVNPIRFCKRISRNTPSLLDMIVNNRDILISRSGTVGNTIIVGDNLAGVAVSEHAMRVVVDSEKIPPEYVYAYFLTSHGHDALQVLPYGSVIITLGEEFLADVDLPILKEDLTLDITNKVSSYIEMRDKSIELENKAISMVEQEIEKWN